MADTRMVRLTEAQLQFVRSVAERTDETHGQVIERALDLYEQKHFPAPKVGPWTGSWNNWIAPFHVCPRCGASLNWERGEDALEQPRIDASCCALRFMAPLQWQDDEGTELRRHRHKPENE